MGCIKLARLLLCRASATTAAGWLAGGGGDARTPRVELSRSRWRVSQVRQLVIDDFARAFQQVDMLLTPVAPGMSALIFVSPRIPPKPQP
jgi:Asp-tRNA(Asn)/Glu-tRNA(Gln) amidotransferase A subunit family amidase